MPSTDIEPEKSRTLASLPPQTLAPGQCGLFLWTAGVKRSFIGFENTEEGKLLLESEVLVVKRRRQGALEDEERFYEVVGKQPIKLSLRDGVEIKEGQRFSGSLTTKTSEGWDRVIPVVALTTCLPEEGLAE